MKPVSTKIISVPVILIQYGAQNIKLDVLDEPTYSWDVTLSSKHKGS